MIKSQKATVECECGCGFIKVEKNEWDENTTDYYVSFYKDAFYSECQTIRSLMFKRIKNAWYTLLGKDYCLFEICLNPTDFENFRREMNEL